MHCRFSSLKNSRRRKRRCDGSQPCRACIEYEYDCRYIDTPSAAAEAGEASRASSHPEQTFATIDDPAPNPTPRPIAATGLIMTFPQMVAEAAHDPSISASIDFGYNVGVQNVRPAQIPATVSLRTVFTLHEAATYCQNYIRSCNQIFPIVDGEVLAAELEILMNQTQQRKEQDLVIEVAVTLAVLIGFYISWESPDYRHLRLSSHAQTELDRLTFRETRSDLWLLRAWNLRTLLLRFCSSPSRTWLSSCTTMHVAEMAGILPSQQMNSLEESTQTTTSEQQALFWISWVLNQFISLETGKTPIIQSSIELIDDSFKISATVTRLAQIFGQLHFAKVTTSPAAARTCILELCRREAEEQAFNRSEMVLFEASILCQLCRLVIQNGGCIKPGMALAIRANLQSALEVADNLLSSRQPWFTLAICPHILCVCLAVGKSLYDLLPQTLPLLYKTFQCFNTESLQDAQEAARALIEASLRSKEEDTSTLRNALRHIPSDAQPSMIPAEEEVWTTFLNQQVFE